MAKVTISKESLWKAIRKQCLNCVGGSILEVERCTGFSCTIYPYRFGRPLKKEDLVNRKSIQQ